MLKTILLNKQLNNNIEIKDNEVKQLVLFLGKSCEKTIEFTLSGKNSRAEILILLIGNKNTNISLKTVQNHQAFGSQSKILVKSILFENSVFKYEGLIKIHKEAQLANAYLRNENLVLGNNVLCDSKPYLEIQANNVYCTHAVSIGNISKEQVFYFKSRGLNEKQATSLILEGVCNSLFNKIADSSIMEKLKADTLKNLHAEIS